MKQQLLRHRWRNSQKYNVHILKFDSPFEAYCHHKAPLSAELFKAMLLFYASPGVNSLGGHVLLFICDLHMQTLNSWTLSTRTHYAHEHTIHINTLFTWTHYPHGHIIHMNTLNLWTLSTWTQLYVWFSTCTAYWYYHYWYINLIIDTLYVCYSKYHYLLLIPWYHT